MNLSRRSILCGLLAAPVVCSASSLMNIRGVPLDPTVRVQTWPFGTDVVGPYEVYEGPQSEVPQALRTAFWGSPILPTPDHPHQRADANGRVNPMLPILVLGGVSKGWMAGVASGAVIKDMVPPPNPKWACRVFAYEALRDGYGSIKGFGRKRAADGSLGGWECFFDPANQGLDYRGMDRAIQRHMDLTARLQERAAAISTWGADLTPEDEIALGLREPELRAA